MPTLTDSFEGAARRIESLLPSGPRVVVLGSTDFWHPESEITCATIGRLLASIPGLVLVTGGVEGIGEAVGRSFFKVRNEMAAVPLIYHLLPNGEETWDYGETLFAGADMTERREILGRIQAVFVMIEGGPRAEHEANVALAHGSVVIPVGRSGGCSASLYANMNRPPLVDIGDWNILGSSAATPEETAMALVRAVQSYLHSTEAVKSARD